MNEAISCAFRRLAAFVIDWLMLALWMGVLFGAVMLATDGNPQRPAGPWHAQAIGFGSLTLPFVLYFALMERSSWHATVGKRLVGLIVFRSSGEPVSLARGLLRNAIKFAPWEFGHTLAQQLSFGSHETVPLWLWGPAIAATIGPVWWLASLMMAGSAPYDKWADVHVARQHFETTTGSPDS